MYSLQNKNIFGYWFPIKLITVQKYPDIPPTLRCKNSRRCGTKNHTLIRGVGCFNSSRYKLYIDQSKEVEKHNKQVMGSQIVVEDKEVLTQLCPDCKLQIVQDLYPIQDADFVEASRKMYSKAVYSLATGKTFLSLSKIGIT